MTSTVKRWLAGIAGIEAPTQLGPCDVCGDQTSNWSETDDRVLCWKHAQEYKPQLTEAAQFAHGDGGKESPSTDSEETAPNEQTFPEPTDPYVAANDELESGSPHRATWIKAMALTDGDEYKARHRYIALRAECIQSEQRPSSSSNRAIRGPGQNAKPHFGRRLLRGDVSLKVTYWAFGFLGSWIFSNFFGVIGVAAIHAPWTGGAIVGSFAIFLAAAYQGIISVAIWRAADKYTGPQAWAFLAKAWVVLCLVMLSAFLIKLLELAT